MYLLKSTRLLFSVSTVLLLVILGKETLAATGNELKPVGSDGSNNKLNRDNNSNRIWQYFVSKYSKSNSSALTSSEVYDIIGKNCARSSSGDLGLSENSSKCDIEGSVGQNVSGLESICSYILYRVDNPACCEATVNGANNLEGGSEDLTRRKPSSSEVWGFGVLFVTVISLSSLLGVSLMPLMGQAFYKHLLTLLIGLAVGSLTGSSVFHLLPQAFKLPETDKNHDYLIISLVACGGIWMFFMVERLLKFIKDHKDRKELRWHHEQSSDVLAAPSENGTFLEHCDGDGGKKDADGSGSSNNSVKCTLQPSPGVIYESQEQAIKASFGHQEKPRPSSGHDHIVKFEQGKDSVIAAVAWMIIFGDGLHNFIDGISIGAAFNESILTGISISLAVLCEELPHELGDFAVLLNAGMSMKQAVLYNFLSACTCYIGLGFGILLGEMEGSAYIFALAGGMFLYIALVDMVPEMNEVAEETSKKSVWKGLKILLLQNIGLFSGITILFALAKFQEDIRFE